MWSTLVVAGFSAGSITLIELSPAGLPRESIFEFMTSTRPRVNVRCCGVGPTTRLAVSPVARSTRVTVLRLALET
jgi:hypothetical protein